VLYILNYHNNPVRRQDRLLEETKARALLQSGEYGVLSLASPGREPYGIPLNYVWDGDNCLYFHGAVDGRKLELIKDNPQASFCVVGATNVVPSKFSTGYESLVLKGRVAIGLDDQEKHKALHLLINKYSSGHREAGGKYIDKLFEQTEVIRFDIHEASGKSKVIS